MESMKNKVMAAISVALLAGPIAASASAFRFSYVFGDGTNISGTFDGSEVGAYVTGVSNVSLSINGNPTGPVDVVGFWGVVGSPPGPYTMSFDRTLTDFWFIDPNALDAGGDVAGNGSYGFALIGSAVASPFGNNLAWDLDIAHGFNVAQGNAVMNDSWSLQVVPEPGSLALLGAASIALALTRRRIPSALA
jgi:hypothetical protein